MKKLIMKNYKIIYYPEIDSTNTHALKNITDFSDKDILMAEVQTAGRGRFDRKWVSDKPNNIYISFVLKPEFKTEKLHVLNNIPQYLCIKLCEVLETYSVNPVIKWPNDVLVCNKKIAGILAQTSIRGNIFRGLVLGIGVNLNFFEEDMQNIDRPAISLNLVIKKSVDRDAFLENLLDRFFKDYDEFLKTGFDFIKNDYIKKAYFLGKTITVDSYKTIITGTAVKIDDNGSLVILCRDTKQELTVNMGEIIQ